MQDQIDWGTCGRCEQEVHEDDLVDGTEFGYGLICIKCEADCLYQDQAEEGEKVEEQESDIPF